MNRSDVVVALPACLLLRPKENNLFCTSAPPCTQTETKVEYDKVIQETEAAYLKILESSQTLLTVLKREAVNISKKKQASS